MPIVNLNHGPMGVRKNPPKFTYTGKYEYIDEGNGHWSLKLLTSGQLTFASLGNAKNVDVFAVGSGEKGQSGIAGSNVSQPTGGRGGNGGECVTEKNIELYPADVLKVTLDLNADTTLYRDNKLIVKARTGKGAPGGNGGTQHSAPGNGLQGTPEFGETGKPRYGGGAGGGHEWDFKYQSGTGIGVDGGGNGGTYNKAPTAGKQNTGGAGGGGTAGWGEGRQGAQGGLGIIIIRDHRK